MALPNGYKRLKWIKSDGTNCINTGVRAHYYTRVVMDVEYVGADGRTDWLFGTRCSSGNRFDICINGAPTKLLDCYAKTNSNITITTGRHLIDKNENVTSVDGEVKKTFTATNFSTSYDMYLLAINNIGSALNPAPAILHSTQIYGANDALVRDYIPAEDENGAVGLWDDVDETFTTHLKGNPFVAGPEDKIYPNKVLFGDEVLIDLTADTVTPETLAAGVTAHGANGELIVGTMVGTAALEAAIKEGMNL